MRLKNIALKPENLAIKWQENKLFQIDKLLLDVTQRSDFKRKYAAYNLSAKNQNYFSGTRRGIGLALSYQGNGFMSCFDDNERYTVTVKLGKDRSVIIYTSAVSENLKTKKIWKEIASSILEIENKDVKIENINTSLVPDSGPSLFSRNITIITQLIERCCNAIKKSRFRLPLPIEVKRSYKLPHNTGWDRDGYKGKPFPVLSWGAVVVETETNPVTLESAVRKVWFAADCGSILDMELARADVEIQIYKSISESMITLQDHNYKRKNIPLNPPNLENHFPVVINFLKSKEKKAGGIGELPDSLIPAALNQALSMALNTKIRTLPSSPVLLFRKIEHMNSGAEKNED